MASAAWRRTEEDLDLSIGLAIREDPCLIASDSASRVLRKAREEFVLDSIGFNWLGHNKAIDRREHLRRLGKCVSAPKLPFAFLIHVGSQTPYEETSTEFCYTFIVENPEKVSPAKVVRKLMRIQVLRCHAVYCQNGTKLIVIPFLASRSQSLSVFLFRNIYQIDEIHLQNLYACSQRISKLVRRRWMGMHLEALHNQHQ